MKRRQHFLMVIFKTGIGVVENILQSKKCKNANFNTNFSQPAFICNRLSSVILCGGY